MLKPLLYIIKLLPFKRRKFYGFIKSTTGLTPGSIDLYELAMIHKSAMLKHDHTKKYINNERLEYLGDAILGAVVAEILYQYFPHKNEGFLTKTRSRLVNRSLLNSIALEMGLHKWVKTQSLLDVAQTSILGDALEALIGAVYLDKGYDKCKLFITKKILNRFINLQQIAREDNNYKSLLIEWGQKHKKSVNFITEEIHTFSETVTQFKAKALIEDELLGEGQGNSKKEAQQNAAQKALDSIEQLQYS